MVYNYMLYILPPVQIYVICKTLVNSRIYTQIYINQMNASSDDM